ncbi:nucleotidyltransferase domain-containing protein [Marinomonas sp. M1K-6]|uniref:Nucleotidyltransferase domain-containing protein n=1 Tax=Marinomonas profundi TaxID=2726122 RepID=A0A847R2I7_9GAMM|nr:nucleotidyltransferase domain-containing protein [Marinomonas profundi]NLQ18055.1 nucleotidyltransferase domain-containing protein [Marinomonas profundi]UDV04157.1 nucleotidyltransferase domain-containing protein [Marinomonas profundi]
MNFGLPESTFLKIQSVFACYSDIEQVVLYGSRAKGNYRPGSDIDLTLKGDALDDRTLRQVMQALDELNTPYLMDVSLFHQIQSEELKHHIFAFGKVFYQR